MQEIDRDFCLDHGREARKGVPEVVLAKGKETDAVLEIAGRFLDGNGRVIISRVDSGLVAQLRDRYGPDNIFEEYARAHLVIIKRPEFESPKTGGRVGVITAGSSDVPVAEEARVVALEMGCDVTTAYDVGVAGIHRLFGPLSDMLENEVDAIIVAAGMDGALPSVVAGLVGVPVIGLPTSVGYGLGGGGVTAILSMLQTCSPGLTVVNIDNGVGAGATAALIANRVARARGGK